MRRLLDMVVDKESAFEMQRTFGPGVITQLAPLSGTAAGVIAFNPMFGGIVDAKSACKQAHFTELCDTFHLPIIYFVDVPGFKVGEEAEAEGILRIGMQGRFVNMQLSVALLTVVVRKCYGMAGGSTVDRNSLNFKIAWPSAEWGSLPIAGGVKAAFRREIEAACDPEQKEREIEAEIRQFASPFCTAEAFGVEDLIDPRETRSYLCRILEAALVGKDQDGAEIPYGRAPLSGPHRIWQILTERT